MINGDFSDGSVVVDTELSLFSGVGSMDEGEYVVTDRTSAHHYLVTSDVPEHGGDGFMMMVNGALEPDVAVWQQRVALFEGAGYQMTVWIRHWNLAVQDIPFDYELRADGVLLGPMIPEAEVDDTGWTRLRQQREHIVLRQCSLATLVAMLTRARGTVLAKAGRGERLDPVRFQTLQQVPFRSSFRVAAGSSPGAPYASSSGTWACVAGVEGRLLTNRSRGSLPENW